MPTEYYRMICDVAERNQLIAQRAILSTNPVSGHETWYTPTRYTDPLVAQSQLALPMINSPIYRVGPVPEHAIVNLTVGPRRVAPAFGHIGGGIEVATRSPVNLFGMWSFVNNAFDSSL